MAETFPDDLIIKIISLLPLDCVFRFKIISRDWKRLIESSYFCRVHQQHESNKNGCPGVITLKDHKLYVMNLLGDTDFKFQEISNVPLKKFKIKQIQSCNGVVCLHYGFRRVVIWNPMSDVYQEFQAPAGRRGFKFAFGFGYDRILHNFKLVAIEVCRDDLRDEKLNAMVYDVKLDRWKRIDGFNHRLLNRTAGVFVDNSIHWLTRNHSIVVFDLTIDVFKEITIPKMLTDVRAIGVLSSWLTVTSVNNSSQEILHAWKSDCWEKIELEFTDYPAYTCNIRPIANLDRKVVMVEGASLLLYDTMTKSIKAFFGFGVCHSFEATLQFYGGKLDDVGKVGGKLKRISMALNDWSQQQPSKVQSQNAIGSLQNQFNRTATPLPKGTSRYFIIKSSNRTNLVRSVQQGVWATQRSNEAKLNEAFDSVENVILIFSINWTRSFQGCAKMTSRIDGSVGGGNWKVSHGTLYYGRNFSLKWLKLCEMSFQKTCLLRNPYNENLPVKISRDCQELEPSVGEELASLLYLEPDSKLVAVWLAAESKREEEKAKGLNSENKIENPDIVPFEDNEEEEESEEEDENYGPMFGVNAQGRGRGRGMLWPPHMPLGRGVRPLPGMRGFPPGMMGGDGFSYGAMTPEGFPMPDPYGMATRGFGPYGPKFSGEFAGPGSGMLFPGRPSHPGNFPRAGFGMMMGQGRPPFMGGMGAGGTAPPRGGCPVGTPLTFLPSSTQPFENQGRDRRDQKGSDQGRGQEMGGPFGGGDDYQGGISHEHSFRNDDSESKDEAPKSSRHGEGKKGRNTDGEINGGSDQQT